MKTFFLISYQYIVNLLFVDNPNSILDRSLSFLANHPALYLTVFYVFFSALGLLFEFSLFSWFEVNIFNYLDASDLFLAAFKYPRPLILSFFYFLLFFLFHFIAKKLLATKYIWPKLLFIVFWPGLLKRDIIIFISFAFLFATYTTGAYLKAHHLVYKTNRTVTVVTTENNKPQEFQMIPIGSTERFLLGIEYTTTLTDARLCDNELASFNVLVRAVPFSNIVKIEYRNIPFTKQYGIFVPRKNLFFKNIEKPDNCKKNTIADKEP